MTLQILTFGVARDIAGSTVLNLEVSGATTVSQLKQHLLDRYPAFGQLTSFLLAVNTEYGDDDLVLRESDEIALIPPVSGG